MITVKFDNADDPYYTFEGEEDSQYAEFCADMFEIATSPKFHILDGRSYTCQSLDILRGGDYWLANINGVYCIAGERFTRFMGSLVYWTASWEFELEDGRIIPYYYTRAWIPSFFNHPKLKPNQQIRVHFDMTGKRYVKESK